MKVIKGMGRYAQIETLEDRRLLTVSAAFVEIPISDAAKAADPALNNYRTYDLQVTVTPNGTTIDKWASCDLYAALTQGNFYSPPDLASDVPVKALWATHPNWQFDTFVSAQNFTNPLVLGKASMDQGSYPGATFSTIVLSAAWGPNPGQSPGTGTYVAARLTMSRDAIGFMVGRKGSTADPNRPSYFGSRVPLPAAQATISGGLLWDQNGTGNITTTQLNSGKFNGRVYLDDNNNGVLDANEIVGQSYDRTLLYVLPNVTPGLHYLRQVPIGEFGITAPAGGAYAINITGNEQVIANFGNYAPGIGIIQAIAFQDGNGNGVYDTGETSFPGATMYLDLNNNDQLDSGEPQQVTSYGGAAVFAGMRTGTYVVREILPPNLGFVYPQTDSGIATINGTEAKVYFRNVETDPYPGAIDGAVYLDLNRDGVREPDEIGVADVRIYLSGGLGDLILTAADGTFAFPDLYPGQYQVRAYLPKGYTMKTPTQRIVPLLVTSNHTTSCSFGIFPVPTIAALPTTEFGAGVAEPVGPTIDEVVIDLFAPLGQDVIV